MNDPLEFLKQQYGEIKQLVGRGLPGAAGNFVGAQGDQGAAGYLPGILTGTYSSIDGMAQLLQALVKTGVGAAYGDKAESYVPNLPHLPGAEEAGRLHQLSIKNAARYIPEALTPPAPTTRGEEIAGDIGESVGTMVFPGAALAKLPGVAGKIGRFIPDVKHLPVTGTGAAVFPAGMGAIENSLAGVTNDSAPLHADPVTSSDPATIAAARGAPQPQQTQPTTGMRVVEPASGAADPYPGFGTVVTRLSSSQDTEPIAYEGFGTPVPSAPTRGVDFSEASGNSKYQAWMGAAAMAAAAGAAALSRKPSNFARNAEMLERWRNSGSPQSEASTGPPAPGTPAATRGATPRVPGETVQPQPPGNVPIPGEQRWRQATIDSNTAMNNAYRAVAQSAEDQRGFEAATGTVFNDRMASNWLGEQARTGVTYMGKDNITPLTHLTRAVRAVDEIPDGRKLFNEYLNVWDERYNRFNLFEQERQAGKLGPEEGRRVGMTKFSIDDLIARTQELEKIPEIKEAGRIYKQITSDTINQAERHGYTPSTDAARLRKMREWYVPTLNAEGLINKPFGERKIAPGSRSNYMNSDPLGALAQHYDAFYKDLNKNTIRRDLVYKTLRLQDADPKMARLFERVPERIDNEHHITIRTSKGQEHYRVNNVNLFRAMESNPKQLGALVNGIAQMRRTYQSGSTGPLSMLGGSFFPVVNAGRNAALLPVLQQKGMASGLVDALAQKHLGFSTRAIPDITRIPGIANAGVRDMGAMFAGRLAETLHPKSGNEAATRLRALVGDGFIDSVQARADSAYKTSMYAEQRALGGGGSGAQGSMDASTHLLAPGDRTSIRSTMSSVDPSLFHNKLKSSYLNTQGLIHEISNIIGDAPISHYYRLNKKFNLGGRSAQELAHAVNSVVGDPGVGGASNAMRAATAVTPYSNVTIQGMDAVWRALKEAPVGTSVAMTTSVLVPALASLYTAMRAGPEAVNHLQEEVSTKQRAANVYLYTGNDPSQPEKATALSLPQEMRVPYALMLEMVANGLNAFEAREGTPYHERIFLSLQDAFSHHVSNTTIDAMAHGARDMLGVNVPGPVNVATNLLAGKQLEPNIVTLVENVMQGRPMFSDMSRDVGKKKGAPNEDFSSTLVEGDHSVFKSVLSNLFGVASKSFDFLEAGARDYGEHGSVGHALGTVANQWQQGAMDRTPMANSVWQNAAKLSTAGPLEEDINRTRHMLRDLAGAKSDITYEGSTRRGGLPIDTGDNTRAPEDPVMRHMYTVASSLAQNLESKFMPRINDLRKYIEDAQKKGDYYTEDQRRVVNMHTRSLHEEYKLLQVRIELMNEGLSAIAGRPVDVRRGIDWKKGVEQFD